MLKIEDSSYSQLSIMHSASAFSCGLLVWTSTPINASLRDSWNKNPFKEHEIANKRRKLMSSLNFDVARKSVKAKAHSPNTTEGNERAAVTFLLLPSHILGQQLSPWVGNHSIFPHNHRVSTLYFLFLLFLFCSPLPYIFVARVLFLLTSVLFIQPL